MYIIIIPEYINNCKDAKKMLAAHSSHQLNIPISLLTHTLSPDKMRTIQYTYRLLLGICFSLYYDNKVMNNFDERK